MQQSGAYQQCVPLRMQADGSALLPPSNITSIVASAGGPAMAPAAAAPMSPDAASAVAYGASTFHADLTASPGVDTNATGLVLFFLSPMESRCVLLSLQPTFAVSAAAGKRAILSSGLYKGVW